MEPQQEKVYQTCSLCGDCKEECFLLSGIEELPGEIAQRGATLEEALGCAQCGLCSVVCPLELALKDFFLERRQAAYKMREHSPDDFLDILADQPQNVWKLYCDYYQIDYSDLPLLEKGEEGEILLVPGCNIFSYAPELARKTYELFAKQEKKVLWTLKCCGKPIGQLGFFDREEKYIEELSQMVKEAKVKEVFLMCPNCYYQWQEKIKPRTAIEIKTVYEGLPLVELTKKKTVVSVHDSCPDRVNRVFGKKVRELLQKKGYELKEMEHYGEFSTCCGSGAQVSHLRPELAASWRELRLKEFKDTNADFLVTYCFTCLLNFTENGTKVKHALDILLEREEDYSEVRSKIAKMWENYLA